ncbi:unnamed protein product [Lasius platythorax]|uniref:Uncharacterized protein n=1 Tax=Lasius platythorax TaxID=488582 RepID=A0AAV2NBJ5_9HYME
MAVEMQTSHRPYGRQSFMAGPPSKQLGLSLTVRSEQARCKFCFEYTRN